MTQTGHIQPGPAAAGSSREPAVLVTGGTGFLGSHLAVELLDRGQRVLLLARGDYKGHSASQRLQRLLNWFDVPDEHRQRLNVLEGHLDAPGLGLNPKDAQQITNCVREVIHCASNTSFASRKREQVEKTNVQGLDNLLRTVGKSPCRKLHLISTAYVAGRHSGLCPEDFTQPAAFHNVYEESKWRAEQMAAEHCARMGISLYVHRPSIVYGDSSTGRTLAFNALYYPIRTMHYFQKIYTGDIVDNNGHKAQAMDIRLHTDGSLHLPVRIRGLNHGGVNLIPVDHFVRAFMAIRRHVPQGGFFHIVSPENTDISRIVDYTQRFFRLCGLRIAEDDDFKRQPANSLEALFDKHMQIYAPYMQDTRTFEHAATSDLLAGQGIVCPEFSYDIFSTCMRYAVDRNWGRDLQ
jgi:nucleoside-diphosphate-sugar epimerase